LQALAKFHIPKLLIKEYSTCVSGICIMQVAGTRYFCSVARISRTRTINWL